ncbi:hypothetical protein EV401DRAFT_2079129 [Pisolithus croceorrhizus]|nr:hypothetical protein EV401DRAFT_2079129 [Pisolithus croceorrhizus]
MSQPSLLMPTPLATTVRDWLVVLDSAIQSDSDDDEAVAKAKYDERQHRKKAQAASQIEGGGSQSHDPESQGGPQVDHMTCARCARAEVDCTYELAKAKQCVPASTKKVWKCIVLAESTSLRAGEKKKHARAKSPEVEVVGGSSQAKKGKSVTCDTLNTGGLYAIAAVIDWHTKEMVQLQQTVKTLGSSHHHMIESMVELLQETMYPEPELPAESGSEESEEAEASDKPGWK